LPFSDFSERFGSLKKVYIDVFGDKRIFLVEDWFFDGKQVFLKFENIDSEKDSKYLIGKKIYVDRASAVIPGKNTYFVHDLVDCKVIFKGEFFGTLIDVMTLPASDVYVIQHKDGKEILIPAVNEFIGSFDQELKELNLKDSCEIFLNDSD
jgi:16S rRNA processing protein RimM